jgi:chromosome segregation protein
MAFLKTIRLSGFKTFAKTAELVLEPGVTVIIGPNGSGKSNIADAVLWALGEQSPSVLRAKSMQDVVYAGANGRKPAPFAEVRLLFDNSSGAFSEEFHEIEIVRRTTREGGSDYAINGVSRRLLDVQEVIAAVGLGREMHSVISQGKVEEFLSTTPRARRALIEEAAGLGVYKRRRERTIAKLERVQANLDRVCDIEREVRAALRPLKAQMHAARHHQELSEAIAFEKTRVALVELAAVEERMQRLRARIDASTLRTRELEAELADLHRTRREEEDRFASAMKDREERTARYHAAKSRVEWLQSRAEAAAQRATRLEQDIARAAQAEVAAREEYEAVVAHLSSVQNLPGASSSRRALVDEAVRRVEARLAEIEDLTAQAEVEEEELRDLFLDLETQKSRERQHLEFLERERREAGERLNAQAGRLEKGGAELQRMVAEIDSLKQHVEGERSHAEVEAAAQREVQKAADEAEAEGEKCAGRVRELKGRADDLETRLEVLRATLKRRAGLPDGARHVLEKEPRSRTLLDILRVEKGYEKAAIAALGPLARALVVDRGEGLRLFRSTPDGIDLLLLEEGWVMRPAEAPLEASAGTSHRGTVAGADEPGLPAGAAPDEVGVQGVLRDIWEVVAGPPAVVKLLIGLVPRTWVVDTVEAVPGGCTDRVVSLAGEVFISGSFLARHEEKAAETVLRASLEEEEAVVELQAVKSALDQAKELQEAARARSEALLDERKRRDRALRERKGSLSAAREALAALEKERARVDEELKAAREAVEGDEKALAEFEADIARLRAELGGTDDRLERLRARVRETRGRVERLRRERSYLERKRTQASVLDIRLREREKAHTVELAQVRRRLAGARAAQARAAVRRQSLESLRAPLSALTGVTAELTGEFGTALQALGDRLEQSTHASSGFAETLKEQGRREGEVQGEHAALSEELIEAQVAHAHAEEEAARTQAEVADLRRRHLSPRTVAAGDLVGVDRDTAQVKIDSLTRRVERIGPVNPLADKEYSEAAERAGFLADQRADLEKSVEELRRVLYDLEEHIESEFTAMFEKTEANFAEMTRTLFPGGHGVLRLEEEPAGRSEVQPGVEAIAGTEAAGDAVNRAAPGIHLDIVFSRKASKGLTLLSGGEKALAAIAFLFALFLARPCPFYVLDEVEAALDDHNIGRFLSLVRRYQKDTQFIIITHQRRTMEIADLLYGVTMEEDGVSRLLSRRLTEEKVAGSQAKAG